MTNLSAFVLGASGTAGKSIVKALVDHPKFDKITLIGRRALDLSNIAHQPGYSKIQQKTIDFDNVEKYADDFHGYDVGFCALGTSSVGVNKEQYYRITHDYVINTAKLAHSGGCKQFHFISGRSTSKDSWYSWARTKAEVEEKLMAMGFERVSIYRPGGIIKDRTEITSTGESIGIYAFNILDPFRCISVDTVVLGKVMVESSFRAIESNEILENADILRLWKEGNKK
ncbi:oxidoreductase HTATIP2-like [Bradysia coprophila]|uniref:oxidoreductase HTATIP2-like n=1 Tax=Bradysia coprophila TaxID=38358 RepID=UPI00187DC307|nr:oxidoreductase HTATIP2-like [Bradysia coprophila]